MRDHGGPLKSETADIDGARALTAAGLDDSLAAIERRTAVVAMMDGVVMLITALRRCLGFRSIADDDGLARHDGLPLASKSRTRRAAFRMALFFCDAADIIRTCIAEAAIASDHRRLALHPEREHERQNAHRKYDGRDEHRQQNGPAEEPAPAEMEPRHRDRQPEPAQEGSTSAPPRMATRSATGAFEIFDWDWPKVRFDTLSSRSGGVE